MANKELFIWGATGQAIVLEDFLSTEGYELIGLFDRNVNLSSPFPTIPLFCDPDSLYLFLDSKPKIYYIVAIGGAQGLERIRIHETLKAKNYFPISAIHPKAVLANHVDLGEGAQVLINATICARVRTGKSVIINSSASVDHECILGDGVHIGPGAKIAGCVNIGDNTFVGTGAVVLPKLSIGRGCIIGAGSVVLRNVPDFSVVVGNPGRVIRQNIAKS